MRKWIFRFLVVAAGAAAIASDSSSAANWVKAPSAPLASRAGAPFPAPPLIPKAPKSPYGPAPTTPPPTAASTGAGSLPPASAGTNGSFKPPPPAARRKIAARVHMALGPNGAARTALLLNGVALAPPDAPDAIKGAISAANLITNQPYLWGGGHGSWLSAGYDCSGAVSFALAGGGFLGTPLTSGELASWGAPGPGQWVTVYANGGHAYAVIAGLRFDTVGDARGSGPRWHPLDAYPQGFTARHFPGY